ncbi:DUF1330 domain-containing protein [Paracoccus albus]|uniref:DUF1330 domain-containing protein n=1 Tax=Paracoccus albus TaxID=3017784 RepID=UPI0022F11CBB|nr:DUF1330 domain-containing protein [Paracoccus albus]WBU61852.1 DUF1330 domain-containing protein [Paracoccus albus]
MPALWIAHVTVTDDEAYKKYAELAGPAITKHGGHFLARGGRLVKLEGNARPRNVVAQFSTLDAGEVCYNSPEYQAALNHARGASERELLLVEISEDLHRNEL